MESTPGSSAVPPGDSSSSSSSSSSSFSSSLSPTSAGAAALMRASDSRGRLDKAASDVSFSSASSRAAVSSPRASLPPPVSTSMAAQQTSESSGGSAGNSGRGKPSLHPNGRAADRAPAAAASTAGAMSAAVPSTVKLLSELERSWAMFSASWKVVDLFAGAQIWQEQTSDAAAAEPLNNLLVSTASAGLVTFLAGTIGGGGVLVALLLTLAVVVGALWTLSAARTKRAVPSFKMLRVVDGAPSEIFLYLMNVRNLPIWDASVERAEVVHTIDDHSDIIHVVYRPVWIWPLWITPRDVCLLRYWRRAEDGSYVICMQSALHPECPPTHGVVRATCRGGGFIISPRALAASTEPSSPTIELSSLVTNVVHLDPCGWEGALLQRTNSLLVYLRPQILALSGLQEVWEARKFVCPNIPDEFGAAIAASGGVIGTGEDAAVGVASADAPVDPVTGEPIAGAIPTKGGHILKEWPTNVPRAMWCEPEGAAMLVRGPDYLTDRRKIPSAPPAFRLVGADLFQSSMTIEHIASRPDNMVQRELKRHAEAGTTMPFTFVMNFVVPGNPRINLVLYYQAPPGSNVLDDGSAFAELMRDFLDGSDEFRNERFKLIPCIVEGPFIVRQAVGTTPAIIGKKLRQPYFSGPQYFELDVDIGSSAVANRVVGLVTGYTKKLVIDMGFLIEGQRADELPERLFGSARLVHLDMGVAVKLE